MKFRSANILAKRVRGSLTKPLDDAVGGLFHFILRRRQARSPN
jgi:hypothetical protein